MIKDISKTTIAVIGGTGKEGKGLVLRWAKAGYNVLILAIAVCIVGGLGSWMGAVLAAFLIGFAQILTVVYLGSHYQMVVALLAIIFTLIRSVPIRTGEWEAYLFGIRLIRQRTTWVLLINHLRLSLAPVSMRVSSHSSPVLIAMTTRFPMKSLCLKQLRAAHPGC